MDIRYYLGSIASHLDPKRAQNRKYVDKLAARLLNKRSSVLKSRNFNTTLVCMTTVDEIYNGLMEKFSVQSDVRRAEEVKRVYGAISDIDFEQFMKSGDSKAKLLYLLFKLSGTCTSFVTEPVAVEERPLSAMLQYEEGLCDSTVCIVDWNDVLFEGEEFAVRRFDVEDDTDSCFQDQDAPSIVSVSNEEAVSSGEQSYTESDKVESQPKKRLPTLAETLAILGSHRKREQHIKSEFSICNRVLGVISGASSRSSVIPPTEGSVSAPILSHLSNGCLRTSVFHLSDSVSSSLERIIAFYKNAISFSSGNEHYSDVGMACGCFLQFLITTTNGLSRNLKPVTLLNLDLETADIRRLTHLIGSVLESAPIQTTSSAPEKTRDLINFSLAVQTRLHAALLGCDTSSASWLLYFWLSAVRPLLRAAIQNTFSVCGDNKAPSLTWFDTSMFAANGVAVGQLNLSAVNNTLSATHRYLTLLKQCREEAGDFLTQSRLFALPMLFESFLEDLVKECKFSPDFIASQCFLSPILPVGCDFALPVDVLDKLSLRWMNTLQAECKKASVQLFRIWHSAGLKSWLFAVRLVFLCQSVLQFDGRNKFINKTSSSPALDLLALHLPRDVWLELVPFSVRKAMLKNCDAADVIETAMDADNLTEQYANCKTVAQALEYMETASCNEEPPLVLFPVSLFFGRETLTKYVRVHSFLSAFHVSKNWLSRSLLNFDSQSSCHGKYVAVRTAPRATCSSAHLLLTPADRLLWLLRSAIFFALSAIQQYFFTSIVCANCHRLEKELEHVDSADDLERIHEEVMTAVVSGCLFPVGLRTYQSTLRHLIVLADTLSRQQIAPKNPVKPFPLAQRNFTTFANFTQTSDDSTLNTTSIGSAVSWKLLATDTHQALFFLADTLSRSAANKSGHSVSRYSLDSSYVDADAASSSLAWLASELHHASEIVSKQSKVLLQLMHNR